MSIIVVVSVCPSFRERVTSELSCHSRGIDFRISAKVRRANIGFERDVAPGDRLQLTHRVGGKLTGCQVDWLLRTAVNLIEKLAHAREMSSARDLPLQSEMSLENRG